VRVAASVFGQNCPPDRQNIGGVGRGLPIAGAPDHGDGREVAESGEGGEGGSIPLLTLGFGDARAAGTIRGRCNPGGVAVRRAPEPGPA
jgi:hypothetical protein